MIENPERLIDQLLRAGILREEGKGEELVLSESFREERNAIDDQVDNNGKESIKQELEGREGYTTELSDRIYDQGRFLDSIKAIEQFGDVKEINPIEAALVLEEFFEPVPSDGVPMGFMPIRGREIQAFVQQHPASIVYFWRQDCDPCDEIKTCFEDLIAQGNLPGWMGKGAVYGSDCFEFILKEFDVGVAPTILFFDGDQVDVRLIGSTTISRIEDQINVLISNNQSPQ